VNAQDKCPVYKMKSIDFLNINIDSLRQLYQNVLLRQSEIDNYLLVGLCNFQELQDNTVLIKIKHNKHLITAKPVFFSGGKGERQYQLSINDDFIDLFNQLSENERIAYIAHEFSHFYAYESKTDFGLFIFGIKYQLSNKYRLEIEQKTNELAVLKGFGYQMLEFPYYTKFSQMQELLLNYGY
jgi:hypothetical protein